jgi:hypothetical protein
MSKKKNLYVLMSAILLPACSAIPLNPSAQHIRIVTSDPSGCEYLGEVTGNQGDFFTGDWTSNANLETGARNAMKNEAAKLGADTVQMLATRGGLTAGGGSMQQTNVTYTGMAYRCNKK